MVNKWTVYRHTSPSGKVYIGITSQNVERRWNSGKGYTLCKAFYNAILKYGWDNIKHEVLFTNLSEERAKKLEIELIMHYKKLRISYNITDGGDGMPGYRHSEEVLVKLRKSLKGRKSPNKGKCMKESTKIKLSIINKGKTLPSSVRDKIRKANSGVKLGDNVGFEKRSKSKDSYCKAVEQLDDTNNVIASFRSAIDAARYYNKGKSAASKITECCRGTRNKTLNNKWRYKYG